MGELRFHRWNLNILSQQNGHHLCRSGQLGSSVGSLTREGWNAGVLGHTSVGSSAGGDRICHGRKERFSDTWPPDGNLYFY